MLPKKKNHSLAIPFVPQESMSEEQKKEMFIHALRFPRLFDEMLRRLVPERHFDLSVEFEYVVLLRACQELMKKHDAKPGNPSFPKRLRNQVEGILAAAGDEVEPEEGTDILGSHGILARASKAKKATEAYGLDLLKRFLMEKEVCTPLAQAFAQCNKKKHKPENIGEMLSKAQQRLTAIQSLELPEIRNIGADWAEHEERLKFYRNREMFGLRTGLKELDRRTRGLQGLTIFGAKPGTGKTALGGIEVPLGICRHHPENDAVVIVVSLDMGRFDLYRRVQSNLSDLDWRVLMYGSPKEDREHGSDFSSSDSKRIAVGLKRLKKEQVDRRFVILDRSVLGDDITAARLIAVLESCKADCQAERALLVVDYLQLLPVPDDVANRGDLTADKFRVRLLQDVIDGSKTTANPLGDAVIAISEARKPSTSKDPWGQSLSELMGTARVGYAPTAALLYRPMVYRELSKYYDLPLNSEAEGEQFRQKLIDAGIAPLILILDKGRDGMSRGEWGVEFHFKKTQFRELQFGTGTKIKPLPKCVQDLYAAHGVPNGEDTAPVVPPPGIGHAMATKKAKKAVKPSNTAPKTKGNTKSTTSTTKSKKA